jgi:hypothetical protein
MTKFVLLAIGALLLVALVFTAVLYIIFTLLKKREEKNPE